MRRDFSFRQIFFGWHDRRVARLLNAEHQPRISTPRCGNKYVRWMLWLIRFINAKLSFQLVDLINANNGVYVGIFGGSIELALH